MTEETDVRAEAATIRVSRSTHELLRELADRSNASITAVVDEAVRDLQRKRFWAGFNAECSALQADPAAWAEMAKDDAVWQGTLSDGLGAERPENEPRLKRRRKPAPG